MSDIQTTREHDKDMLIAGFQHDLAKARAEIERLRAECNTLQAYTDSVNKENERLRATLRDAKQQIDDTAAMPVDTNWIDAVLEGKP